MSIETFFFDLGNVLVFFDHEKMHHNLAKVCSLEVPVVRTLIQTHLDAYERGSLSSQKLHTLLCEISGKEIDWNLSQAALCDIFQPNLEMISIIEQLKKQNKRLFILSNTCAPHFEFLQKNYPLLSLFDGYILSYEVGARKPEKTIFQHALDLAKNTPCFYTDDVPAYIDAARGFQIDAEVFTTASSLKEHLTTRGILLT